MMIVLTALMNLSNDLSYKPKLSFICTIFTTITSVASTLMYIAPHQAVTLKILWMVVAIGVVTIINFAFLPYSVEKETENNLHISYSLNKESIKLIKA